jgi:PilZ domain
MEKRPESRISADVPVRVWGMDADGKPFFQSATAGNLSSEGAQVFNINHSLKIGDVIGIQYGDRKARFEVIWVKPALVPERNNVGVMTLAQQTVPWEEVTAGNRPELLREHRGSEKRMFTRHKVQFPIQISFSDGHRPHMQCSSTDIGGRGCYVETMVPLHISTDVIITFWIDSEKIKTTGVVRTSDPGVGMGIEFTALEEHIQNRLQAYLDKIDQGFAKAATQTS